MASNTAPEWMVNEVRSIIDALGSEEAAGNLGLSRATLARVVGKLPVYPGTLALVESKLKAKAPTRPHVQDVTPSRRRIIDRK